MVTLRFIVSSILVLFFAALVFMCSRIDGARTRKGKGHRHMQQSQPQDVTGRVNVKSSGDECSVFYRVSDPKATGKEESKGDVLLLHGASFDSSTWLKTGTLGAISADGYRAIAIDLPGFGESAENLACKKNTRLLVDIFSSLQSSLKMFRPVLLTASMSGKYALTLLSQEPELTRGYIMVAPVIPSDFDEKSLPESTQPTLIIYGSEDAGGKERSETRLMKIPNAVGFEIKGGSHPCYLDYPDLFNERVLTFLRSID